MRRPGAGAVAALDQLAVGCDADDVVAVVRVDGEVGQRDRRPRLEGSAVVVAGQHPLAGAVVGDENAAVRDDGVEVGVAEQRWLALDTKALVAQVGMAAGDEAVGAGDGEAHGVLVAVPDALGAAVAVEPEQARMGGGVERAVGGVDPEAVHVDQPRVLDRDRCRVVAPASQGPDGGGDDGDGEHAGEQQPTRPPARWMSRCACCAVGLGGGGLAWRHAGASYYTASKMPAVLLPVLATVAGAVSFSSPCCLPLVPGYLSYMSALPVTELGRGEARAVAVRASALFVAGFTVVFTALGVAVGLLGATVTRNLPGIVRVAGVVIIVLGLAMAGVLRLPWLYREWRVDLARAPRGPRGAFPLGMAFAAGWTPCIGPVLATILATAAAAGTAAWGGVLLAFYSLGLGIPFVL
ncbi:MAG: cytochrome c biogenesis CcdA family protein, partial [Actinomycetes bacterium]